MRRAGAFSPMMSRWLRRCAIIVALLLASMVTAAFLGCDIMIAHALVDSPNKGRAAYARSTADQLRQLGVSRECQIESPGGAELSVWIVEPLPDAPPKATVLVIHGIRDSKRTQVMTGHALAAAGYRAVLVDLRGHGDSSGDFLSYGVAESRDLTVILDELKAMNLLSEHVGVVAASYGAACGLQLAACDPRIKAVVSIAAFTSLREVVPGYLKRAGIDWLVSNAALERAFHRAELLAGFDVDDASPLQAIQKTRAQVLLIHGEQDSHIPASHSQRLHEASANHSKLVLIPRENHDTIMGDRTGIIKREMLAWLNEHLR